MSVLYDVVGASVRRCPRVSRVSLEILEIAELRPAFSAIR